MPYSRIFNSSPEACTGCRFCEMVCSLEYDKTGINPERSRIKILNNSDKGLYTPSTCRLCLDAPCVESCPTQALSQNNETGVVAVDEEECTGCELCIEACEFNSILMHPEKNVVAICDLCGGELKCIKYCMQKALVFLKPEEYELKKSKISDKKS